MHRRTWRWKHLFHATVVWPWLIIELVLDVLTPPMFIANITLNELNLQGSNLPNNEQPYAVGQWSPLSSALLLMIAAAINKGLEIREQRKSSRDIPREEQQSEATVPAAGETSTSDDPRVMEEGGQVSGVVVPKLVHTETLKDMEKALGAWRKH
jgi:hypothetical protein